REKVYRDRVKVEVDAALRDSGLRLEGEKRDQFEQRYLQERRRIEHALRQETEAKRQEQLPALRERLKKEFQEPSPSATSTSAPAGSTSPKKYKPAGLFTRLPRTSALSNLVPAPVTMVTMVPGVVNSNP